MDEGCVYGAVPLLVNGMLSEEGRGSGRVWSYSKCVERFGVIVTLLDMMNHNESDAVKIEWDRHIMPVAEEQKEGNVDADDDT